MRRFSRVLDNIWKTAEDSDYSGNFGKLPNGYDHNGDPVLSDDEFSLLSNLYHKGHSEGMHHREQIEFHQRNGDLLNAHDVERSAKTDHDMNLTLMANIFSRPDVPEWHSYIYPSLYSKGFLDALGANGTSSTGLTHSPRNKEGRLVYDPPNKNNPWGREGRRDRR